ncbi:ThiF family adenylyltransferase [Aquabacterium sp. A7-Y]|uniref:HesA/MoeB/ThiF family protein n=1 Tax=Aquabacterium sp. A7-Y TaxID=1349605 RepID=UPI00223E4AEA|nr:ThiF family adenylyltransferase [Aquabacterium sp. A7-Y]MCW7541898.1 ThiF family adenylyltransferase [Aquabacterium sp. A7-Y]
MSDILPVKPIVKRSHNIIVAENGDICIGELPESAKVIRNPDRWVPQVLEKLDGEHTVPRIVKEVKLLHDSVAAEKIEEFIGALNGFGLLEPGEYQSPTLTSEELERYNRQILQFGLKDRKTVPPAQYQEALKRSTILILGMGGWGTWCALNLALSGVGKLKIVDGDVVELSNLNRQVLYSDEDIGAKKVFAAKKAIARVNGSVKVEAYDEFVASEKERLEEYIDGANFIILAWASLGYYRKGTNEEAVHAIASAKKVPLMELGGDPIEISAGPIYPNQDGLNLYADRDFKRANRFYSEKESVAMFQKARMRNSFLNGRREVNAWQSSPSLSIMSGIVADQVIKYLTGYDRPELVGTRFFMSLNDFSTRKTRLF